MTLTEQAPFTMSDMLEQRRANPTGEPHWIQRGLDLAETSVREGGFAEWFDQSDGLRADVENPLVLASTAIVMENAMQWLKDMSETVRAVNVGGYIDYILPVIRAGFSQQIAHELVSVQPMTKRIGQIFYLHYRIGQDKGSEYVRGQHIFDARTGFRGGYQYSDESVPDEDQGTGAASTTQSGSLTYLPVRRATVVISFADATPMVIRDDGNGGFVVESGALTISSGSINYETGAWTVTFSGALTGGGATTADYEYDSEISPSIPTVDIEITASSIKARRRALRSRVSVDGQMDYAAEFGQDLNMTIAQGISEYITAEQSREIISDLWLHAGAPITTFPRTPPVSAAYSRTEHFRDLVEQLNVVSNAIWQATQRAHANWIVCDANAASLIKTIPPPQFDPAPVQNNVVGVQYIGTLSGYRVFKDPHLQEEPGASANGNLLMGYKGPEYWDAGYVWAPYQVFQTQQITLDDFITRQAYAYRYAKKMVNPNFYRRMSITP